MRNAALHHHLEALTVEASGRLSGELAAGAEIPFEIDEERGRADLAVLLSAADRRLYPRAA